MYAYFRPNRPENLILQRVVAHAHIWSFEGSTSLSHGMKGTNNRNKTKRLVIILKPVQDVFDGWQY